MYDVVIIGGGHAGEAVNRALTEAQLNVCTIEECCPRPDWWDGDWVQGRGAVAAKGLAVALDPETADERRILPCKAIVIAVGRLDPQRHSQHLLGITKLGAEFTEDKSQIVTDTRGRTRAPGIFAIGSCASTNAPDIVFEVIGFCKAVTPVNEQQARA